MAKMIERPTIDAKYVLEINADEAGALDAISGYGVDQFLKVFYEHMGESYLKRHEAGFRSLLETVRGMLPGSLERLHAARQVFDGTKVACNKG